MDREEGSHVLEGNGCIPNFFYYVWKKRQNSVSATHDLKVPSTVVYCDGFPKEWHVVTKQGEIERRIGKEISTKEILKEMCFHGDKCISEDGAVVAWYLFKVQQPEGGHKPAVEYFDRKGLDAFLHGKVVRRDGFLQKFVYPDGKHCVVIQAIWSPNPAAQLIGKRENNFCFNDRRHSMVERITTFEGPIHYSREAFVAPHIQWQVKRLCKEFVDHFRNTEHAAIQRMVLYFKVDRDSELWFLWCSSIRIFSYGKRNPLDLCVEYLGRDTVVESLNPHGINLIEGSAQDSGEDDEVIDPVRQTQQVNTIAHLRPPSIGPIGTVYSRSATVREKYEARQRASERIRNGHYKFSEHSAIYQAEEEVKLEEPADKDRPPEVVRAVPAGKRRGSHRDNNASYRRRSSALVLPEPSMCGGGGVLADDKVSFMGYRNIHGPTHSSAGPVSILEAGDGTNNTDDDWNVLMRPLPKPRACYYWDLLRIAFHTGVLREMVIERDFIEWIKLNGNVEASRQNNMLLQGPRTDVIMSKQLHDAVGQPLTSYLAMFQVTVRRVDVNQDMGLTHLLKVTTGKKPGWVALQIGKQQSASVLWNKMGQFCATFFEARYQIVKKNFAKYKRRALSRELKAIGVAGTSQLSDDFQF